MSGEIHPPLLTPAQAAGLLEQVVFEQVLECVDLDALCRLEQSLTLLVGEIDGIPGDRVCELAKDMLDRALLRLPDDIWHYLRAGVVPPAVGCELCEDEPRPPRPDSRPPARHSPTRLKS